MRKNLFSILALFLLLLIIPGVIFALPESREMCRVNYDSIKENLTETVKAMMEENKLTGLSIALVDGDQTVWVGNFGYADLENKIPVTGETIFKVASISKLFTGTAVMQLAEAGKIAIDQPLQTYIPEFSMKTRFPGCGPITARSVMTHHSGIPGEWCKDSWVPNPPYFTDLLSEIKDDYTAYPPNYIYAYSNLGTALLGVAVERTSGEKFSDYMDEHILKPLEMNHSAFELRDDLKPLFAKGYYNYELADEGNARDIPAGGLYSTANDLSNFIKMVFAGGRYREKRILKHRTLMQMLTPQNDNIPLDLERKIGLNWFLSDPEFDYAGKVAHHAGDTKLYHSMLKILPWQQLGVVVLTNSASDSVSTVVNEIANETLKLALKVKTGLTAPAAHHESLEQANGFSWEQCRQLVGDYGSEMGLISITHSGNDLEMKLGGTDWKMVPYQNGWFSIQNPVSESISQSNENGNRALFTVKVINHRKVLISKFNRELTIFGEALKVAPIPAVWVNRLGEYQAASDTGTYSLVLKIEGRFLTGFQTNGENKNTCILTPLNDDELLIRGLGRGMHETIRVVRENGEQLLFYSGIKFKKVR